MDHWVCKGKPSKLEYLIEKNPIKKMSLQENEENRHRKEKIKVESKVTSNWQSRYSK